MTPRSKPAFYCIVAISCAAWFYSCQPEEEIIISDPVELLFNTDTVKFDTLLTSRGSITKRFKVYNPAQNAVSISRIHLGRGLESSYSLTVNGVEGRSFSDQLLMGGDSLLILAEAHLDPQDEDAPFLVKDSVVFETNGAVQDVKLVAWGQDAVYLEKQRLSCDAVWSAERPIVLLDTVVVDSACTLVIDPGARIYADQPGAIIVEGSLRVNGSAEKKVEFTHSRLDMKDAFGQWSGITFTNSSHSNRIDYASIRNAWFGLFFFKEENDAAVDLELNQVEIENMLTAGLVCYNINLIGRNVLINNCADFAVACFAGGSYLFTHCTFANYSLDFVRENPAVYISNVYEQQNVFLANDLLLDLHNSIIWGDLKNEIVFGLNNAANAEILISHTLLKTEDQEWDINDNILNQDPKFKAYRTYNYALDTLSPAKDRGSTQYAVPVDINGNERDDAPDLGAFERLE